MRKRTMSIGFLAALTLLGGCSMPGPEQAKPADTPAPAAAAQQNNVWKPAISQALEKTAAMIPYFEGKSYPHVSDKSWKYKKESYNNWTAGFYPGMLWLSYQYTKDEKFKQAAEQATTRFKDRLKNAGLSDTHDLGFLYTLTTAAQWMAVKDTAAKQTTVEAADALLKRYRPESDLIQAWGKKGDKNNGGRIIIDTMMNLPLLYWASEQTNNEAYRKAAISQANKTLKYIVRPDNSSFHTYYFDQNNGQPLRGATHQGYKDDSTWARGQAWGIYGFALSYRYTKNEEYLEASRKMARYFIEHLPPDQVAYWDFNVPVLADTPRDSSASAIAACGVLELLGHLPKDDKDRAYFEKFVNDSMTSLVNHYSTKNDPDAQGLLKYGAYNVNNKEFNQHTIWGDYFYLEALMRLDKGLHGYWYE
nr:glycoside hydrolase family 88 protein [Paenibacillus allorhizosphaerae]